jgi:hypothetical protein
MIISHEHRFIFIKNRKVGSTSTELALQQICGPDDVLTHDGTAREISPRRAARDVLAPNARNYDGPFSPYPELLRSRSPVDAVRIIRDWRRRPKFYNHMRAASVRARIPTKVWESYYKFCFDRNPWDKVVSFYYWYGRKRDDLPEINEFLVNHRRFGTADQILPSDWVRYAEGDRIIVDDVFDFRDLEGGLATALKRAGVPDEVAAKATLGRAKTEQRKTRTVALLPETDALIRRAFRREIARLDFCREPDPLLFTAGTTA